MYNDKYPNCCCTAHKIVFWCCALRVNRGLQSGCCFFFIIPQKVKHVFSRSHGNSLGFHANWQVYVCVYAFVSFSSSFSTRRRFSFSIVYLPLYLFCFCFRFSSCVAVYIITVARVYVCLCAHTRFAT